MTQLPDLHNVQKDLKQRPSSQWFHDSGTSYLTLHAQQLHSQYSKSS